MTSKSPDIEELAELVWRQNERLSITALLERGLSAQGFDLCNLALLDRFQSIRAAVCRKIKARIDECDERGITPRFRFSSVDADELVFQTDAVSESVRMAAIKAVEKLSWRNFERLCCYVLRLSGVDKCAVMRGTKEGGIDVFGILEASQFLHPAIWKGARLRVFCQVKKGRVDEPVVRLFNNDLHDLYRDKGRAFALLPTEMQGLKSVLLGGVFSARGFTDGAEKFARARGFFLVDPDRIVEVLLTVGRDLPGLMSGAAVRIDIKLLEEYLSDASEQN
jgi:hypothetical protein